MTSNLQPSKLKIANYSNGDVVTYPLVRLVGELECKNPQEKISIHCANSQENTMAKNGKFKILLELEPGENIISLTHDSENVQISLEYKPNDSKFSVMPLYVICEGHDGLFQAPDTEPNDAKSACQRITLCSKLLQSFTAEKLLGKRTFNLEECQIFHSRINYQDARRMSQRELWENIGRDIMSSSIAFSKRKYLAFLSCTIYDGSKYSEVSVRTHEDALQLTHGYVALGGGGLALFGTACLYTWPETLDQVARRFEERSMVERSRFLDDSCYRGTLGACFSTTLGSVLHELYHTFDLGHTKTGIMGRGFDNISKFFCIEEETGSIKSYYDQIEFKEKFEGDTFSERLENAHKRKEFHVRSRFEEDDWTVLDKSCAVILAYHKWFNKNSNILQYTLSHDSSNNIIRSTLGIRVVELRKQPEELIVHHWTFEGKILKFSFRIPDESLINNNFPVTLFVMDNHGNILKTDL